MQKTDALEQQFDTSTKSTVQIAVQIAEHLLQANIPLHKQRTYTAKVLDVSYAAARRLLTGESAWSDGEIASILDSVGLIWKGLHIESKEAGPPLRKMASNIVIDGVAMECDVYVNGEPASMTSHELCLREENGVNTLAKACETKKNAKQHRIASIQIHPSPQQNGLRLAILDDNADVVDGLRQMLDAAGFRTEGFTSPDDLSDRILHHPKFDGYLLDWSLPNGETIGDYIEVFRSASPHATMAVMSGHFDTKSVDHRVMELSRHYKLAVMAKPVSAMALVSHFGNALQDEKI